MVRIGLISDVHANLYALRAAVARLRAEGVDAWVCAGDLVGYGPHPNECVGAGSLYPTALPPGPADVALTGEGRYLSIPGRSGSRDSANDPAGSLRSRRSGCRARALLRRAVRRRAPHSACSGSRVRRTTSAPDGWPPRPAAPDAFSAWPRGVYVAD